MGQFVYRFQRDTAFGCEWSARDCAVVDTPCGPEPPPFFAFRSWYVDCRIFEVGAEASLGARWLALELAGGEDGK
jgi:hypothetical protein